jgi:hypothetical protein
MIRCSACGRRTELEVSPGGEHHARCDACTERELGLLEKGRRQRLSWLYTCAHRAVKLARTYVAEDGKTSLRARGCMAQIKVYRRDIRALRSTPVVASPGLAKGRAPSIEGARKARAS